MAHQTWTSRVIVPRCALFTALGCPLTSPCLPRPLRTTLSSTRLPSRCSSGKAAKWEQKAQKRTSRQASKQADSTASSNRMRNNTSRHKTPLRRELDGQTQPSTAKQPVPPIERLLTACDAGHLPEITSLYPTAIALGGLEGNHTRRIAQALHAYIRTGRKLRRPTLEVVALVDQMVEDIKSSALPTNSSANLHLLGMYKEVRKYREGYAFWQYLQEQDDSQVSQAVYGVAIELMVHGGIRTLPELENLYQDGLKRFPGTFAEYHLSPDAIVTDRSRATDVIDMPLLMLQGIVSARLVCSDWRNSYLALNTALRLYPLLLPDRFYALFIVERPLDEACTVYLMACRAGLNFKPHILSTLLQRIKAAMLRSQSMEERLVLLRAVANTIYASLEAGGSLEDLPASSLLDTFKYLLPGKNPGQDYLGQAAIYRNAIASAAHKTMAALFRAGLPPQPSVFAALISLAGRLHVPGLLAVALQDLTTSRLELDQVQRRAVVTAAGHLGDKALLAEYWDQIVSEAESNGTPLDPKDAFTFAKSCWRARQRDYCVEEMDKLPHLLLSGVKSQMIHHLNAAEPEEEDGVFEFATPSTFETHMAALEQQCEKIVAVVMSGQPLDFQRNPFYMSLDPQQKPLGSSDDLRTIYDEYSVDPHQPPAPANDKFTVLLSSTGFSVEELRFQNWLTVLELMDMAYSNRTGQMLSIDASRPVRPWQHMDRGVKIGGQRQEGLPMPLGRLRNRITLLRNPRALVDRTPAVTPSPISSDLDASTNASGPGDTRSSPLVHSTPEEHGASDDLSTRSEESNCPNPLVPNKGCMSTRNVTRQSLSRRPLQKTVSDS